MRIKIVSVNLKSGIKSIVFVVISIIIIKLGINRNTRNPKKYGST